MKNDQSFLWHDIAVNSLYQYKLTADMAALESALNYITKAISLNKSVSAHYCLLGTIYMEPGLKDAQLSQAYLIKSIELNSKVTYLFSRYLYVYISPTVLNCRMWYDSMTYFNFIVYLLFFSSFFVSQSVCCADAAFDISHPVCLFRMYRRGPTSVCYI